MRPHDTPTEHTTRLLRRCAAGDGAAVEELLPLVYDQLRSLARHMLAEHRGATLQPTELIHEAYVRLVGGVAGEQGFEDRRHFRRVAAKAMRHVLVDRARARHADKRGGGDRPGTLDEAAVPAAGDADIARVLQVHDALAALARVDPQLAEIVELRVFGGETMEDIAGLLGVSRRTVQRGWQIARAWWVEEYGAGGRGGRN